MRKRIAVFVLPVFALALFGLGCNPLASVKQKAEQKAADALAGGILSQASGGKVEVNSDKGSVGFKDDKTGDTIAFGEDIKLPANFPQDVLMYDGVKILSVMTKVKEKSANVTLTSTDDAAKVLAWYEDSYKRDAWTLKDSASMNQVQSRNFNKSKVGVSFSIWPDPEKKLTYITLSRAEDLTPEMPKVE